MSKAKYFYVYAVINFEQRLAYIGSRGSNKSPLEDPYMGSYDKKSKFKPKKKLILSEHNTRQEAYDAEREWQIKFDVAKSNLFVNKGIVTTAGFSSFGMKRDKKQMEGITKARSKPISIKNCTTKEVLNFPSYTAAARFVGVKVNSIQRLAVGKRNIIKNYVLAEKSEEFIESVRVCKRIALREIKSGEIKEFDSLVAAARFLGCKASCVSALAKGKFITLKGFVVAGSENRKPKAGKKPVKLISPTGEILEFASQSLAAKFIGCHPAGIWGLAKGLYKQYRGYRLANFCVAKDSS
jgi:hypothetical protein